MTFRVDYPDQRPSEQSELDLASLLAVLDTGAEDYTITDLQPVELARDSTFLVELTGPRR
jgi:hypothetical protein